jgi:hypothetical protein
MQFLPEILLQDLWQESLLQALQMRFESYLTGFQALWGEPRGNPSVCTLIIRDL